MKIRQNPIFPTTPIELVRELSVLWRELSFSFDSLETTVNDIASNQMKIKAIYRGTISVGGGAASATATITEVVLAKAIITNLGSFCTGSAAEVGSGRVELTNETTVTAYKNSGDPATVFGYQVIEYE